MNDTQRLAALRIVFDRCGSDRRVRSLAADDPVAFRLDVAQRAFRLPADDLGIYGPLGAFLPMASRDQMKHLSLIWFKVWSSAVHGVIMAV
jgi:hypothetical protein